MVKEHYSRFNQIANKNKFLIRMGIMLAAGSMSRIIGPIIVVTSYTQFGTGWTFGTITIFMTIPMILLYGLRNRLLIEIPKTTDDASSNGITHMTDLKAQSA